MSVQEVFRRSVKQIRESRNTIKHNTFFCECGGIMNETGDVLLCEERNVFVDKYELKCSQCGEIDHFVVKLGHLEGTS